MATTHYENALYVTANIACDKAVEKAGWVLRSLSGGRNSFYPVAHDDVVGVGVNNEYHYLVYLNRGFASFPMKAIYGKTVPILGADGQIHFRTVTGINQFRPGHRYYWQRNAHGELVPEWKQRRAWVHTGYPAQNLLDAAVSDAVKENQDIIDTAIYLDKYEELEQELDRQWQ